MLRHVSRVTVLCAAAWLLTVAPLLTAPLGAQTCLDYESRFHWVGSQPSAGMARGVAAGEEMFAVLEGVDGVELFGLLPDESPVWLASIAAIDSTFQAVFSGSTLFVADGANVVSYDVSVPTAPAPLDTLALGDRILSLAGYSYALAACCGTSGLVFVHVGDPANMEQAATVPIGGPGALDVAGRYHELIVGAGDSLLTVDGFSPDEPHVLARVAVTGRASRLTRNEYLACAAGDSNGVAVVDLADLANPTVTVYTSLGRPRELLLQNIVLFSTTTSGALRYHQVLNAHTTPLFYGYSMLPQRTLTGAAAPGQGLAVLGDVLLVASGAGGGQGFMPPESVPAVPPGPSFNWGTTISDLAVSGSLVVAAKNGVALCGILDTSNLSSPAMLSSTLPAAVTLAARDEIVYVLAAGGTLTIHDLSVPASPQQLSSTELGVAPVRCALSGNWLYVTVQGGGLLPVDVSDPGAPAPATTFTTLGEGHDLAVAGGVAYLVDGAGRLETISVADPAAPVALGSAITPGDALGVCTFNGFAYVADGAAGIAQVDVHDPAHPAVVGSMTVGESATAIAAAAGMLYVGDTGLGLLLGDARDPYDFYFSGQLFLVTPPVARVKAVGDFVYVMTSAGYLSIGRRSCATTTPAFLARFTADLEEDAAVLRWETSAADGEFRLTARAGGAEREVPWTRVDERRCEARDTAVRRLPGATVAYTLRWRGDGGDWEELASRSVEIPAARTALHDPYPNPFNPRATVAFTLDRAQHARLAVHDARGRLVAVLADGVQPAGRTELVWDGRDGRGRAVAADTYFLRLEAESTRETRRVTLVK